MANINVLKFVFLTSRPGQMWKKISPTFSRGSFENYLFLANYIRRNNPAHLFSSRVSTEITTNETYKPTNYGFVGNSDLDNIVSADVKKLTVKTESALDECTENVSEITPFLEPSFNLASFVNTSPTLQELVKLGVKLHKIEKMKDVPNFILTLNFEENIKGHLRFLHDIGLPADQFGMYLTKNPLILKEDLEDLQIRINYLYSKKFTQDSITRIVTKAPKWLSFRVVDIDKRLGYFQKTFILSGEEVRTLATKRPTLITQDWKHVETCVFTVKEEMGFSSEEMKQLLLAQPKLFSIFTTHLRSRFNYFHNEMKISHDRLIAQPNVLLCREFIIKQRHLFLKSLCRDQYDPKLEGYVSLDKLVKGTDAEFCLDVAKTSVHTFNTFLKSL